MPLWSTFAELWYHQPTRSLSYEDVFLACFQSLDHLVWYGL